MVLAGNWKDRLTCHTLYDLPNFLANILIRQKKCNHFKMRDARIEELRNSYSVDSTDEL